MNLLILAAVILGLLNFDAVVAQVCSGGSDLVIRRPFNLIGLLVCVVGLLCFL